MKLDTFLHNSRAIVENNMAFYSRKADSGRKLRSKSMVRYFQGITRNASGQAVTEWKVPSATDPEKAYRCYISIEPQQGNLFVLARSGGRMKERMELIKTADVRCFCTCPDFNWSGMKYNMKHRYDGYEEGHTSSDGVPDGSDIRPRVRDPRGKNTVCKHLLACFNGIMLSAPSILKATREAKFPQEYTKKPETPTTLDKNKSTNDKLSGKLTVMNDGKKDTKTTGEVKTVGGTKPGDTKTTGDITVLSKDKKAVVDYPSKDDEIKALGESAPVKIPEAQQALDALAASLGQTEGASATPTTGEITAVGNPEAGKESGENSEITVLGNGEDADFSNPLTDIEDAAQMPMFNTDDDDDDMQ